jgi:hypothetical protein
MKLHVRNHHSRQCKQNEKFQAVFVSENGKIGDKVKDKQTQRTFQWVGFKTQEERNKLFQKSAAWKSARSENTEEIVNPNNQSDKEITKIMHSKMENGNRQVCINAG